METKREKEGEKGGGEGEEEGGMEVEMRQLIKRPDVVLKL